KQDYLGQFRVFRSGTWQCDQEPALRNNMECRVPQTREKRDAALEFPGGTVSEPICVARPHELFCPQICCTQPTPNTLRRKVTSRAIRTSGWSPCANRAANRSTNSAPKKNGPVV